MNKLILVVMLFSILSCEKLNYESNLTIEKLKSENIHLKQKNDSLNIEFKKAKLNKNYWFDIESEGIDFINKGIKNPEKYIENSLRKNPELIPLEPILGGKMFFENIQILGNKWLIADYSDGHISGRTIYSYKFNKNNTVEFKSLSSTIQE
ncbi:hypothetical protein IRZ71_10355 [Flavobacterium sp. ANB]|uniref:hypothetical protein n=1 Tax=unclassified Flavobacterium TaxID=196869 RepID=UPI0012B9A130|nr:MULTISPECIES: hypothetical protein [unclassified Flavobacterium]MBF4516749.1 hypothetical protein [Flavobacterium sp. ANB]MTD69355.1 hypothetical protein [Flavobacterium sp. LC2016-13]